MTAPLRPIDFSAVDESLLLDSARDDNFDRLTKLATKALRAPVALISLIDRDRQFFKSECGLAEPWATKRETPLTHSFCQTVVLTDQPLIISDARNDERVRGNLAISDLGVVAYAGVPIKDTQQRTYGAFCVIDGESRCWSDADVEILQALAAQVTLEVELRRREIELHQSLQRVQKLESDRRRMTRLTVHDLRTPLQSLLLSLDAAELLGELNAPQRECLAISKRNGRAIQVMVDDLLDIDAVAQLGETALSLRETLPSELVGQAVDQVRLLIQDKGLRLENKVPVDLRPVAVDADKIVRVLVNLLGNAVKFSRPGGRVGIQAHEESAPSGNLVVFLVSDDGIGIESSERAEIFQEGVKVDSSSTTRVSAGLGLTFCKMIVELHGGSIWVDSEPGLGSVFGFSIPCRERERQ